MEASSYDTPSERYLSAKIIGSQLAYQALRNLRIGDAVVFELTNGRRVETTVNHLPWQLKNGAWVIGVAPLAGGICCSRVRLSEGA